MCDYCNTILQGFQKEVNRNEEHVAVLITLGKDPEHPQLRSYQHPEVDDTDLIVLLEEMLHHLKQGTVSTRPMKYNTNPN